MISVMWAALGIALLSPVSFADSTFRSRPDLAPPQLNITISCPASGCAPGYLFVAPYNGFADDLNYRPSQPGAYILTDSGDLVWSGFTYFSPWNANFQASKWNGQDVLFCFEGRHNGPHGHGHGHHTFLNQNYKTIRELRAGGPFLSDKHEFIIVNEQTALIQIYQPVQRDLTEFGGAENQTWIVDSIFQELSIETGQILFQWHSLDHVSPTETKLPLPLGLAGTGYNSSTAWNYFHINSITKDTSGNYLISARHASTVLKVNGTDGSIIWRLGGDHSDFALGPDVEFGFQHHVRYLPGGNSSIDLISLFDNSAYGSETAGQKGVQIYPHSRGKYIALDHDKHTASVVQLFNPPNNSIAVESQGSLQSIPGGNVLINWGSEGQITEYSAAGDIIYHAHLDSGDLAINVQNYRAFKYNWTGFSSETPALAANYYKESISLYASWNGDTRVRSWHFIGHTNGCSSDSGRAFDKTALRNSFETELSFTVEDINITCTTVVVEAIGKDGSVLGRSEPQPILATARSSPPTAPRGTCDI